VQEAIKRLTTAGCRRKNCNCHKSKEELEIDRFDEAEGGNSDRNGFRRAQTSVYGSLTQRVGSAIKNKFVKTLSTGKLMIGGRAVSLAQFRKDRASSSQSLQASPSLKAPPVPDTQKSLAQDN